MSQKSKRSFLKATALVVASAPLGFMISCGDKSELKKCVTTEDILGPFYRENAPTRLNLNINKQTGTPLTIKGTVFGEDCKTPMANAVVDVWHADNDGEYDNDSDDFNFRGRATTDANGRYEFNTILPGRYLNGGTFRPSHIHYKVTAPDHKELVTQLYFSGDEFIDSDPWASEKEAEERIITLVMDGNGGEEGTFDVKLMPV